MADESKYPTRIAPYGLRMPDDLKARVQASAEANNRSMNAEIIATLMEKYPKPFSDDEELLIGAAAAMLFRPSRADGQFAAAYNMIIKYFREVRNIPSPEKTLEELASTKAIEDVSAERVKQWIDRKLSPWGKAPQK